MSDSWKPNSLSILSCSPQNLPALFRKSRESQVRTGIWNPRRSCDSLHWCQVQAWKWHISKSFWKALNIERSHHAEIIVNGFYTESLGVPLRWCRIQISTTIFGAAVHRKIKRCQVHQQPLEPMNPEEFAQDLACQLPISEASLNWIRWWPFIWRGLPPTITTINCHQMVATN